MNTTMKKVAQKLLRENKIKAKFVNYGCYGIDKWELQIGKNKARSGNKVAFLIINNIIKNKS